MSTSCFGGNVSSSEYPKMSVVKACHTCNPEATESKDFLLHSNLTRRAFSSRSRVTSPSCTAAANFWTIFLGPKPETSPQIWRTFNDHSSWALSSRSCDISPATTTADLCLASLVLLLALEFELPLARSRCWCVSLSLHPHLVAWVGCSAAQQRSLYRMLYTEGLWVNGVEVLPMKDAELQPTF